MESTMCCLEKIVPHALQLDQIRRERNRMHAKRTRDRKRIFMEEMEVMIKQLEDENALLQNHFIKLNEAQPDETSHPQVISPELGPISVPSSVHGSCNDVQNQGCIQNDDGLSENQPIENLAPQQTKGDFLNQIESLLAAAGAFEKRRSLGEINAVSCAESDVTASPNHSGNNSLFEEDEYSDSHPSKKPRISDIPTSVPTSITTTNLTTL